MPSQSEKQKNFFGLVRAVQKGEKSPHEVSPEIRKIAKKISAKDAGDFASSIAELRTKRAVLSILKELREPMYLNEEGHEMNAVAKEFTVPENYEAYVKKHVGQPFAQKELEALDNFQEAKPTKIERTEIRYETTDDFSNSTTVVIKKMKDSGQFSFIAFTKHEHSEETNEPESIESPEPPTPPQSSGGPGAPAPEPAPEPDQIPEDNKDDVIVSKSVLFTDDIKGGSILSEFLKKLDI